MPEQTLTLNALPLFPLATVLFPGGVLPLRVFEVRYLDMVTKCHRAGAPFGVVALTQGAEVQVAGAPAEQLESVGTLAHITHLEQPQPGLLLVHCQGEQRFRIDRSWRLTHGLWVANTTLQAADALVPVPSDLQAAADALRQVYKRLRACTPAPPLPHDDGMQYEDCAWVANRWCELLPLPVTTRQRLMALDNPLLRLELVADMLSRSGIGRPTDAA